MMTHSVNSVACFLFFSSFVFLHYKQCGCIDFPESVEPVVTCFANEQHCGRVALYARANFFCCSYLLLLLSQRLQVLGKVNISSLDLAQFRVCVISNVNSLKRTSKVQRLASHFLQGFVAANWKFVGVGSNRDLCIFLLELGVFEEAGVLLRDIDRRFSL